MFKEFKFEIKLFLIVALVVVVLALGGILLLQQAGLRPSSPTPIVQIPPPPAPSPQPLDTSGSPRVPQKSESASVRFAGWQTYRSEEFGFVA